MKQVRDVIIKKKRSVADEKDFVVVLKPNEDATYKDLIDILDEMLINDVKRYALVDISDVENQLIKITEANGGTQ
jgi:biopolymer transport protein ExbD